MHFKLIVAFVDDSTTERVMNAARKCLEQAKEADDKKDDDTKDDSADADKD